MKNSKLFQRIFPLGKKGAHIHALSVCLSLVTDSTFRFGFSVNS